MCNSAACNTAVLYALLFQNDSINSDPSTETSDFLKQIIFLKSFNSVFITFLESFLKQFVKGKNSVLKSKKYGDGNFQSCRENLTSLFLLGKFLTQAKESFFLR